jgi:hypothetical protein
MQHTPDVPAIVVSVQVLIRFVLRIALIAVFATLGRYGFTKSLEGLLALAVVYCIFAAVIRRESLLGPALTHFDEAAAYALCARLAAWAS